MRSIVLVWAIGRGAAAADAAPPAVVALLAHPAGWTATLTLLVGGVSLLPLCAGPADPTPALCLADRRRAPLPRSPPPQRPQQLTRRILLAPSSSPARPRRTNSSCFRAGSRLHYQRHPPSAAAPHAATASPTRRFVASPSRTRLQPRPESARLVVDCWVQKRLSNPASQRRPRRPPSRLAARFPRRSSLARPSSRRLLPDPPPRPGRHHGRPLPRMVHGASPSSWLASPPFSVGRRNASSAPSLRPGAS